MKNVRMAGVLMCLLAGAATLPLPAMAENPDHVRQLRETRSCSGCDLQSSQLAGLHAEGAVLTNADLRGAVLYKAKLRGADLTGAWLTGANFTGADLAGARGASLAGAITDATTRCPNGAFGPC
jgi:uncharacterized protein YjbI with pentapeptide repeats